MRCPSPGEETESLFGDENVTSHTGKASTVADAFENALNAHDIDGLGNLLADDVTYWEANLPGPIHGREAVKDHMRENWKSFPDSHLRLANRVGSGGRVAGARGRA